MYGRGKEGIEIILLEKGIGYGVVFVDTYYTDLAEPDRRAGNIEPDSRRNQGSCGDRSRTWRDAGQIEKSLVRVGMRSGAGTRK